MKRKTGSSVCFHLFTGILALIMLYPLLWMFSSSLKATEQIFVDAANLIPKEIHMENYKRLERNGRNQLWNIF